MLIFKGKCLRKTLLKHLEWLKRFFFVKINPIVANRKKKKKNAEAATTACISFDEFNNTKIINYGWGFGSALDLSFICYRTRVGSITIVAGIECN